MSMFIGFCFFAVVGLMLYLDKKNAEQRQIEIQRLIDMQRESDRKLLAHILYLADHLTDIENQLATIEGRTLGLDRRVRQVGDELEGDAVGKAVISVIFDVMFVVLLLCE